MKRILNYGPVLKTELRSFIVSKKSALDESVPWGIDFLDRLEPFATSGKLLRGSVLCFAFEAFSGQASSRAAVDAALALELTHSALLIHDDIMDGDDKRRGRPSMHRQYQAAAERRGLADSARFGTSMALSGGDAVLFMAAGLLGRSKAANRNGGKLYSIFAEQLMTTCTGQMQDVYFGALSHTPSKKALYGLMRSKTASYTLALPLAMGAALAGAPAPAIKRVQAIGVIGGTIFQIRDDELGVMGDTKETGKPVGSDIRQGKKTLLYYHLEKRCAPAERRKLDKIFGNPAAGAKDIAYVQSLVKSLGIPELLGQEIERLRREATPSIDKLPVTGASKAEFKELVDFCARRPA